jgi:hypothetical protein
LDEKLNVRGESAPRQDPYRFWLTGIAVEYATFLAFAVVVGALTLLLTVAFGN